MKLYSVLISDDEKLVLDGLCRYIEHARLPLKLIGSARNGTEALELCRIHRPDIVITDVKMPEMDGITLTKEIQKLKEYTPCIIAISAYSDFTYVHQLIKNPFVIDYILKPIDKTELYKTLNRAIEICGGGEKELLPVCPLEGELPGLEEDAQWDQYRITAIAPIVRKVMDYVEIHYADPNITLADIAKRFFVSPNYLSFCFKKEMGIGFTVYLRNFRIEKSKELLKDITLKIYEVSNMVGITDSRYYTRVFKEVTGIGPKEYRKQCL